MSNRQENTSLSGNSLCVSIKFSILIVMSDKMQNSGQESDKNRSTSKEEKKDKTGQDKEESNSSTVNQLCTLAQGRCSTSITSSNDPDLSKRGMPRTKRRLSKDSQILTPDSIYSTQDVFMGTTSSFEDIFNLGNSDTEGHSESNNRHASSSNIKQGDKCGAENKQLEILNPANTLPREVIDKMQNSGQESDKNKSTSKEEKKDKAGQDKEESNCSTVNQLCTVAQGRCSASTTSINDPDLSERGMPRTKRRLSKDSQILTTDNICNKQDVSLRTTNSFENISNLGNSSTEGRSESNRRHTSSSNVKQCDKCGANSGTENKPLEILNPATTLPREMSDVQQNSLNSNSHEYVPQPKQSSPEVLTYGKPSSKAVLLAISRRNSSSTTNHNPLLKSSSDGAANSVPPRYFKGDGLDTGKKKGETTQEAAEEGSSGNQAVVEEQEHGKIAMAGEEALTYFGTNEIAETKATRSTNNSLLKSRPVDEVPCRPTETEKLIDKYRNNSVKRLLDNDTNKFGGNSIGSKLYHKSDENDESMRIACLGLKIRQSSQASNSESSVQSINATRNKMFGEDASSVTADDSNTKQQDSSNVVNKWVELKKRVYQLQSDKDRMKKEIEHMTQENVKKKKSLKESQQWIATCSTLVDPIIKELENKESVWKFLVRLAIGRTLMSNNIVDKISLVCEYANNVTHRFINLSNDLKRKDDLVQHLECQLRKTKENFNQKAAEQLKIIKETEAQHKKEVAAKKNIDDKFKVLEGDIKKYKEELLKYEGQSEQIKALQNDLRKKNQSLKDFERHTYFLQNHLKGAALQLENFKEKIIVTHDELQFAERHFHQSFGSFEAGVTKHSKVLSLEEVSKKAEQNFIDHALQRIAKIRKGAAQYEPQIKEFEGNRESKTYLDIKEKLRRRIQELDTVESHTRKEILAARKEAIHYVTTLCDDLERKVINC